MFSAGLSFLPPFCVPVSDASQVIYLFHLPVCFNVSLAASCVVVPCAPWWFSYCHNTWTSVSPTVATLTSIANPPVNLPTCKFSQSLSVLVLLLWSSPAWTSLENSQNWFLLRAKRLLSLLLQKKNKKLKNSFCSLNGGFDGLQTLD